MLVPFFALILSAHAGPLDSIFRLNVLPFGNLQAVFGTADSPLGGITPNLDSRLVAAVAQPPFLTGGHGHPAENPECINFFNRKLSWRLRFAQKQSRVFDAHEAIALVTDPGQMAKLTAEELTCLFYLGYAPPAIPRGIAYGRVYYVLGSQLINEVARIFWGGKLFFEIPCGRKGTVNICVNNANKAATAWGELYIAATTRDPSQHTYFEDVIDHDPSLIVDYSADFESVCPNEVSRYYDTAPGQLSTPTEKILAPLSNTNSLMHEAVRMAGLQRPLAHPLVGGSTATFPQAQINLAMLDQPWPIRGAMDELRWVGRDEESGTDVFLGRALFAFPEGARTGAWFNLKFQDLQQINITYIGEY